MSVKVYTAIVAAYATVTTIAYVFRKAGFFDEAYKRIGREVARQIKDELAVDFPLRTWQGVDR